MEEAKAKLKVMAAAAEEAGEAYLTKRVRRAPSARLFIRSVLFSLARR